MKKNMGKTDQILRGILGITIVGWGVVSESWLGAIGLIPLFTAFVSWCPAYVPIKFSTRSSNKKD